MAGRGAVQLCGYLRASYRDTDKRLDLRTFYPAERSRRRMRPTGRALSNSAQAARRRLQHATGHCIFHSEFSKEYYLEGESSAWLPMRGAAQNKRWTGNLV